MPVRVKTEAQVVEGVLVGVEAALLVVRRDPNLTEARRRELEQELLALVRRLIAEGLRAPAVESLF